MSLNPIGKTVEITSTFNFKFVLTDDDAEKENLVLSYVEIPIGDNEQLIARIMDVKKENFLLSIDQAGVLAKELLDSINELSFPPERFECAIAECEVIGNLNGHNIEVNRKSIPPAQDVYPVSEENIKKLFYCEEPGCIPIGKIESYGTIGSTPITVNGDELVTKHFAIFGMTGSGKTNTSAKIIEELTMRDYKTILFDPHDDYKNITNFKGIYKKLDEETLKEKLSNYGIDENKVIPFLNSVSVIYNRPIWQLVEMDGENIQILNEMKPIIENEDNIKKIIESPIFEFQEKLEESIQDHEIFPEIKYYGRGFEQYSIGLMEGFLGENFTYAQRRFLRKVVKSTFTGKDYIDDIRTKARAAPNNELSSSTKNALLGKLDTLEIIYKDLIKFAKPKEIDYLTQSIFLESSNSPNLHRFSLSILPERMRKVMVYAIISYIFRAYKFGIGEQDSTIKVEEHERHPILFLLEEARTLVPSSATSERDYSGWLSVSSLRDLAYEGRKFKLAYGLISQKPSTIDAEVSSQCNSLILHQLRSPDDQEYVKKVTEGLSKTEIDLLKNIGTGKAIVAQSAKQTTLVDVFRRYSIEGIKEPKPLSDIMSKKLGNLKESLII